MTIHGFVEADVSDSPVFNEADLYWDLGHASQSQESRTVRTFPPEVAAGIVPAFTSSGPKASLADEIISFDATDSVSDSTGRESVGITMHYIPRGQRGAIFNAGLLAYDDLFIAGLFPTRPVRIWTTALQVVKQQLPAATASWKDKLQNIVEGHDYDEEFLAPTNESVMRMSDYLSFLGKRFGGVADSGAIVPDGCGGIESTWRIGDRILQLIVPAKPEVNVPYLFRKQGPEFSIEKFESEYALESWYSWLVEPSGPSGTSHKRLAK